MCFASAGEGIGCGWNCALHSAPRSETIAMRPAAKFATTPILARGCTFADRITLLKDSSAAVRSLHDGRLFSCAFVSQGIANRFQSTNTISFVDILRFTCCLFDFPRNAATFIDDISTTQHRRVDLIRPQFLVDVTNIGCERHSSSRGISLPPAPFQQPTAHGNLLCCPGLL